MIVQELVAKAPSADALLAFTESELDLVLLNFIQAASDDKFRRMVTCDGVVTQLFGPGGYDLAKQEPVRRVVMRAWRSLEASLLIEEPDATNGKNGYRVVSAEGRTVDTSVDLAAVKVRNWLTPELLHPTLHGACLNAFKTGDYDTAVFEAFKAVEAAVRKKSGFNSTDFGVALMRKAFDPDNGPLTNKAAQKSRREARQRLFMGVIGELRNPKAHGDPTITNPQMAIEEILTASLLLRTVGT